MLVQDGALILKFWFHLSKKDQRKQLKKLEKDPKTRWRVSKDDWRHHKLYDSFVRASERALRRTDSGSAPWIVVEASQRSLPRPDGGAHAARALRDRLADTSLATPPPAPDRVPEPGPEPAVSILDSVDLTKSLSAEQYDKKLARAQGRMGQLARAAFEGGVSSIAVFEGWDAAGKGGDIRRLTAAVDAAPLPGDPHRRAHRRGAGPPLPVALLAPLPARRPRHDLRPHLVRPGAGRARRGLRHARTSGSGPTTRSTTSSSSSSSTGSC